jgi:hypothetical protein
MELGILTLGDLQRDPSTGRDEKNHRPFGVTEFSIGEL